MEMKVYIPPIKIQGIKTKLIPSIIKNIDIDNQTTWIEPFFGSGVVGFNVNPQNAIFADSNPHIINFYKAIQDKKITSNIVRRFLEEEGKKLNDFGEAYYYEVRDRFNANSNPLDFLFLNRSCFNGMIRFNRNNKFNVPYGHKDSRFSKSYITKIVNQIKHIEEIMDKKNWIFLCQSFEETIKLADGKKSFLYCDPPYIGRHVDYFDSWDESLEKELKESLEKSGSKFMLSTWDHNQYRKNEYIDTLWGFCNKVLKDHYYFVGAKEQNRTPMVEALLTNYTLEDKKEIDNVINDNIQLTFEQLNWNESVDDVKNIVAI